MKIIDILALILLYIFIFYKRWKKVSKKTLIINTIFYIYISGVLYFTLMPIISSLPSIFNHPYAKINLNLYDDLIHQRGDYLRQIILNIIMLIPFGIIYPITQNTKSKFIKTITHAFLFILTIEFLQPLIAVRSADITDIVNNLIGTIIGYLIYLLIKPIINKILTNL